MDLTPLVDVIFQLILFFMVSTTFDESSNISIELPQSSSEMLMKEDQNFDIWIDKDGLYYIEEQPHTRENYSPFCRAKPKKIRKQSCMSMPIKKRRIIISSFYSILQQNWVFKS